MNPNSDNGREPGNGRRLDSWKQIAAYLNREVRTAHRWEKHEGLPVHRHQHSKRGTVYAYTAEIDAWLDQRSVDNNGQPDDAGKPGLTFGVALAAFTVLVVTAAAFLLYDRSPSIVGESLRMLIASTENRTGEDRFDNVVDAYLESELSGSNIEVIPPLRIVETLALMREPTDRDVSMALMLEIAARNPDADLIATSALDRFGTEFAVTVNLLEPVSGATLESVRTQAPTEDEIPKALDAIVARTFEAVNAIELPDRTVHMGYEPVTTSSLRAVGLYWDATLLMFHRPEQMPAAEEQLREAVAIDPEFATAYIQLAFAIHEQGRPESDWAPFAEQALELADDVSQAERYFIIGSYHKLHGNLDQAHAQFLALNASHPEHFWGQFQMAELSHARGTLEGAAWSMALAADLKPRSIEFQYNAFNFILTTPHPWTLPRIRERLLEINSPAGNGNVHPFMPAEFYELDRQLLDGKAEEALAELRTQRRKLDGFPSDVWTSRSEYAARLAEKFVTLGRFDDAEELIAILRADDTDEPRNTPRIRVVDELRLQLLLSASRNEGCCLEADVGFGFVQLPDIVIQKIRSGQTEFEEPVVRFLLETDRPVSSILRGEIALQNGNRSAAIELLSSALDAEFERLRDLGLAPGLATPTRREILLAAETLAKALIDEGKTNEAISVLERWSGERARVAAFMSSPPYAPYWIRLRWKLESLYREAGRTEEADGIRTYLANLLALTDEDHYVARSLRGM